MKPNLKRDVASSSVESTERARSKKGSTKNNVTKLKSKTSQFQLEPELLLKMYETMIKARALEERLIKMYKQSEGYFWIGGPGEEAFNVPLGLQVKKGEGKDYDYLHLHYRSSAILTAMGADPMNAIRQMKNTATDPYSGGRNFSNHFSVRKWNVIPVASTIETQYATAIGTGIAQRKHGGTGLTIVNGGDAGTAEGEFASCLIWSSRPGEELPILIIVTNNEWGISTAASTQHGEKQISDRGKPFGIKTRTINGNDAEESYLAIKEAMDYIRSERKPYFIEAKVSRLYGHSSASGANFTKDEVDPILEFEKKLLDQSLITEKEIDEIRENYTKTFLEMAKKVKEEPKPEGSSIYDYVYHNQRGKYW